MLAPPELTERSRARGRPREETDGVNGFLLSERIRRRGKYAREKERESAVRLQMETVQHDLASKREVRGRKGTISLPALRKT